MTSLGSTLQILPPDLAGRISDNLPIALGILAAYIVVFLGITYFARRRYSESLSDYVVASRGLSWIVASLTLVATVLSGVGMAGFPGTVYSVGIPFITMILVGYAATAPAIWYLGRRMWIVGNEYNLNTPGDLLGDYYQSDTVRFYTVLASVAFGLVAWRPPKTSADSSAAMTAAARADSRSNHWSPSAMFVNR